MKVHYNFDSISTIKNPILTIGTFDGVHLGHQKIINSLNEVAKLKNGESVLFTFHPHPRLVLNPDDNSLQILQTQEEKIEKLARMGLNHLIIYPFTKEFSNTKATDFIKTFLIEKLKVNTIVVGYDHHFGKNREGSLEDLVELSKSYPFEVIEIPAREIDEVNISSTKIRQALVEGNIARANRFLNEAFEISGIVQTGKQLGRTIGFPTANIKVSEPHKLIPKNGVYAVKIILPFEVECFGMMNIGYKPTVSEENEKTLEVFIFDFNQDIYNQKISVYLLERMRDERKFASVDELKTQLIQDEQTVRALLATR